MQSNEDKKFSANSRINRLAKPAHYPDAVATQPTFSVPATPGVKSSTHTATTVQTSTTSFATPTSAFRQTGFCSTPNAFGKSSVFGFGFVPALPQRQVDKSFSSDASRPSGSGLGTSAPTKPGGFTHIQPAPGSSSNSTMVGFDHADITLNGNYIPLRIGASPGFPNAKPCTPLFRYNSSTNSTPEDESSMETDMNVSSLSFGTPRAKFPNRRWIRFDKESEAKRPRIVEPTPLTVPSPPVMTTPTTGHACICERSPKRICCVVCAHLVYGVRIRRQCPVHPNTNFLMDLTECPHCRSDVSHLREFNL